MMTKQNSSGMPDVEKSHVRLGKIAVGLLAVGSWWAAPAAVTNQVATKTAGTVTLTCAQAGAWQFEMTAREAGACAELVVTLTNAQDARPPTFEVAFENPGADLAHVWVPNFDERGACRLWPHAWGTTRHSSQLAYEAPLCVAFNTRNEAKLAFATSETFEHVAFGLSIHEDTCQVEGHMRFFAQNASPRKRYETHILIDRRGGFWSDRVRATADWIAARAGLQAAHVPESAYDPLYSTWYAYMQNVHADELAREAKLAADLGMKTMILDDGWQKKESASFYSATGDWNPTASRFPDMKAHVAAVHKAGLKYMIWYSVPYVGDESAAWKRFEGKFLRVHGSKTPGQVAALDPRYPEVREYLIGLYERTVRDWGFDGLKLDFIDQFVLPPVDPAAKTGYKGCDFKSLPEAVDRLMKDILARLKAINPDVLIEFRQHYLGPAIRQYGNMIRAADAPVDPASNRKRIADLRLTSGETAVHADMLVWSRDETAEGAARPILNALFGVIQYSMVLQKLPPQHGDVIRHWLRFSMEHRDTLLKGSFRPHHPEQGYPYIEAESAAERIGAVYVENQVVDVGSPAKRFYLLNGTLQAGVTMRTKGAARGMCFDTFGRQTGIVQLKAGLNDVAIPACGHVVIEQ